MSCCPSDQKFDGSSVAYTRALWAVIFINLVMFVVEISAGFASGSQSLKADALDFAGDTMTYSISLLVIGRDRDCGAEHDARPRILWRAACR
jgi:Co/Zn/Cd efflux system component